MAAGQHPHASPLPAGRPAAVSRVQLMRRGRPCTDGPSSTTCSVSALRRPRLRARAPDFAEFTDSHHAPKAWAGEAVLYRPIQKRHLPATAWPVRTPLIWPRGRGRLSPVRRFTAPVGSVGLARMSSRPPAPVSHDPRAYRPAGDGGCVADLRTTVYPVHVPIPRCKRASDDSAARPRSRSYIHSDPHPRFVKDPEHLPRPHHGAPNGPKVIHRPLARRPRPAADPSRHLPSFTVIVECVHAYPRDSARSNGRSFAGASPRMVDVRRERARQHRPRPCHR